MMMLLVIIGTSPHNPLGQVVPDIIVEGSRKGLLMAVVVEGLMGALKCLVRIFEMMTGPFEDPGHGHVGEVGARPEGGHGHAEQLQPVVGPHGRGHQYPHLMERP